MPDHPHCHITALVFSLYTRRDIDSDDSYARPVIHVCAQPIVWFERERKLRAGHRAETRQTRERGCFFWEGFRGERGGFFLGEESVFWGKRERWFVFLGRRGGLLLGRGCLFGREGERWFFLLEVGGFLGWEGGFFGGGFFWREGGGEEGRGEGCFFFGEERFFFGRREEEWFFFWWRRGGGFFWEWREWWFVGEEGWVGLFGRKMFFGGDRGFVFFGEGGRCFFGEGEGGMVCFFFGRSGVVCFVCGWFVCLGGREGGGFVWGFCFGRVILLLGGFAFFRGECVFFGEEWLFFLVVRGVCAGPSTLPQHCTCFQPVH